MAYNGKLRQNEIFAAIYNMIISQHVFADNIRVNTALVDRFKVDGTLYGDTKLYYSTDVLASTPWGQDAAASTLLALHRPKAPETQAISIDTFRQIPLTVDNYLTKRAFMDENTFSSFTSVMLGWIGETKKVYESTLMNSYIGTTKTAANKATVEVDLSDVQPGENATLEELEAANRLRAMYIAESIANTMVDLADTTRDFTDYKQLRSYDPSRFFIVWNSRFFNKIRKVDLPTIFNQAGLMEDLESIVLPSRFFGTKNTTAGKTEATNTTVRSLLEKDYGEAPSIVHVFPGDLLPDDTDYLANETYTETDDIICKLVHKDAVPLMSGFSVGTSFFNPKSLTENHYLTWGHNSLEYLKDRPIVTFEAVTAEAVTE